MKIIFLKLIAFYLRNSPVKRGRYRLTDYARPIARALGGKLGIREIKTKHGFSLRVNLADRIPQDIFLEGEYEATTTAIVKTILNQGDIVVDVGANIGYFSLLFAKCVGTAGAVLAFEPSPGLSFQAKENFELNNINQIKLYDIALSDHEGEARFYAGPAYNSGLSALRKPANFSGYHDVQLSTYDQLVGQNKHIALVKIDVEGAELQVLRGMKKMLQESEPILFLEVTDSFLRDLGDSAMGLLDYIRGFNYTIYVIGEQRIVPLGEIEAELPDQWNALCTKAPLPKEITSLYMLNN